MVSYTFSPKTKEVDAEFEASLIYKTSFKAARDNLVSKKLNSPPPQKKKRKILISAEMTSKVNGSVKCWPHSWTQSGFI